jgi:tetratricopeptide (TPR) repeat protein
MENRLPLRISLGLIVAVMVAYLPVRVCDFVNYDDGGYVYKNAHVNTGLSWENLRWAWTSFDCANWHPLTWMSHQLDCQLFGLQPRYHHFDNVFWHIANTVGLYLVLRRMTGEDWRPALVAALFGLHPLHVESVAWVAERKDVLSTFFFILALGAYARYAARPALGRYVAVAAAFALGLLCKPMVVTLPFVLLLLDYWPLRRTPLSPAEAAADAPRFAPAGWSRLLLEKVPLLALSAASSFVTMHAQVRAMKASEHLSLGFRLANALVAYATYLRKMVWPVDLAVLYWHPGRRLPISHAVIAAVVLAVLTLLAVALVRRRPAVLVGWLWYLGVLVPAIGVVQVGFQAMADRYTYVPLIGIFMALAWCIPPLPASRPLARFLTATVAGVILLMCVSLTWRQTLYWRDDPYLWPHIFAVADNPLARCYYAGNLYGENKMEEAEEECRAALRLDPAFVLAFYNLGRYRLFRGDIDGALDITARGVSLNPNSAGLRNLLGLSLACQERNEEACRELREACRLEPDTAAHHFCLAAVLARLGDRAGAEREYREGRRLDPSYLDGAREAIEDYINGKDARKNCPPYALFLAEQIREGSETADAEGFATLAKALALNERLVAAHAAAQRALTLAEANGRADLLPSLRELARSYELLARNQDARAATLAAGASATSSCPGVLATLSILEAVQAQHRLLLDTAR